MDWQKNPAFFSKFFAEEIIDCHVVITPRNDEEYRLSKGLAFLRKKDEAHLLEMGIEGKGCIYFEPLHNHKT